ncbi:PREDICTED: elongation of very long chain fatty acids protein AAEL008004-like, partial [Vollenhovia emeryi]|uniref:elongation of very long chain fatty acids protein AAEL008004-like n=1 Tax=Vollenhovia emeryi TaxID=411798 RepID=UPI0005F54E77
KRHATALDYRYVVPEAERRALGYGCLMTGVGGDRRCLAKIGRNEQFVDSSGVWDNSLTNYIFAAPETRDWLFISSPYPVLLITVGYLYFVLYAGPCYMKNRPPYKLRTFILIYNLFQILANLWLLKLHKDAGWFSRFTEFSIANCGNHYAGYLDAPKIFSTLWWVYLLKLSDYIETCVFVLRKKQNQVSSLHTFHHVSTVTFSWFCLKYFLDVRASYFSLLNCFVHVIMYIYYFISAWSPNLQRIISPFKPLLTKLQMASINTIFYYQITHVTLS